MLGLDFTLIMILFFVIGISIAVGVRLKLYLKGKSREKKRSNLIHSRVQQANEYKELLGIENKTDPNVKRYICPRCNVYADEETNICPKCGIKL